MSQRQFRTDDTSRWMDGFSNGAAGPATLSGTWGSGVGGYIGGVSGTATATSLNMTGVSISYGGWPCMIYQTRNGGSGVGNWELNFITSSSGSTVTTKYPLIFNYDTTAQGILLNPYSDITISGTLTAPAWNGSTGGIIVLMASNSITLTGTLTAKGKGYAGGAGINHSRIGASGLNSYSGEGSNAASAQYGSQNGNGGRGAFMWGGGGTDETGASGGSNSSYGATGYKLGDGGHNGNPGDLFGNNALTLMAFGGGGGGGITDGAAGDSGGPGGGLIFLLTPKLVMSSGTVNFDGGDSVAGGGGNQDPEASGGAGGNCLIKCITADLGTNRFSGAGGLDVRQGATLGVGGPGGIGRIHMDYARSYTGSTSFGSTNFSQDNVFYSGHGGGMG